MAKKQKAPEHENLERWLVSYADFITLLFATFVVLYALSQTDVAELSKIDESLQKAFSKMSILQGNDGVLDSGQSILDSSSGNAFIQELMAEYISAKYESQSFEEIEKSVNQLKKEGELDCVNAEITDQGLLISFDEKYLFQSGSAELTPQAKKLIDKIGVLIYEKFVMHCIRVEGHTDSVPISSAKYPSNWELSSARACTIVRYMISRFKFNPKLFTAVGFADTRPVNSSKNNNILNRRVEIMVLKNKFNSLEKIQNPILSMNKEEQIELQSKRKALISQIKSEHNISPAAKALMNTQHIDKKKIIDMRDYAESQGINLDNKDLYNSIQTPKFKDNTNTTLDNQLPQNTDLEL